MATPRAKNIDWIDSAKGFCILMVVLYHAIITTYQLPKEALTSSTAHIAYRVYEFISSNLAPVRMPLFFMLSGFVVQRAIQTLGWGEVIQKRIINLVWLYLLWAGIQWLGVGLIRDLSDAADLGDFPINSIYADELFEYLKLVLIGSSSVWYLYALPLYFLVCKAFSNRPMVALGVLLFLHVIGRSGWFPWPTGSILANAIYYFLGCFYGNLIFDVFSKPKKLSIYVLLTLFACALVVGLFGRWKELPTSLILLALCVVGFSKIQEEFSLERLRWIGRNTLQIYVIHRILLEITAVYLVPELIHAGFFNTSWALIWWLFFPVIATAGVTGVCVVLWRMTNRGIGVFLYKAPDILPEANAKVLKRI